MNKEELNQLLDCIYELEGLVHLALARDDSPESLPLLIRRKGKELAERAAMTADGVTDIAVATPEPETTEEVNPEPTVDEILREDDLFKEDETVGKDDVFNEDEILKEDEVFSEEEADKVETAIPQPEEDDIIDLDIVSEGVRDGRGPSAVASEPRGRLVFSINDRYRFKRELFNNSDSDFNDTLARVASMESYDEAEGYFLDELQWDAANGDVADFLEILKKYFKE